MPAARPVAKNQQHMLTKEFHWGMESLRNLLRADGLREHVAVVTDSEDATKFNEIPLEEQTALLERFANGPAGAPSPLYAVAVSEAGSIVTGGKDKTARIWPAGGGPAGKAASLFTLTHPNQVNAGARLVLTTLRPSHPHHPWPHLQWPSTATRW